jgi:hypothetical protein
MERGKNEEPSGAKDRTGVKLGLIGMVLFEQEHLLRLSPAGAVE